MAFVGNMSPTIMRYDGLDFILGTEDQEKRKHIHVKSNEGKIKIWLEPKVEYDPRGKQGNFKNQDITTAVEQAEEHCDEFKEAIEKVFAGEKVPKQKGYKVKGKNRKGKTS